MKKLFFFAVFTVLACAMVSCGSQKQVAANTDSGIGEETITVPALQMKLDARKGELRGYGTYNDSDMGYAYRGANANARADVSEQIASKLQSAIDLVKMKYGKGINDVDRSDNVKDTNEADKFNVTQIADEVVVGAKAIKVNTYKQKNGTFTTHVCVEVDSDMIAEQIANNKKLESLLTDEEKMKIDFDREQFKKEMKRLFDEYKEERNR